MRKYYWYLTSYTKKHGLVVLLSLVFAIIIFSFFIPSLIKSFDSKKRLYIGLVGQYSLESLPPDINELISSGLTKIEADGTVSPNLAERWIIENDGQTYRFVIKQGVEWQDGREVEPKDIGYNFKDVEVITTPNDIVFKLPEAFVPFPNVVAKPIIKYINQRYFFVLNRNMPIGIGSYRVVDYKQDNQKLKEIILDSPRERRIYRFYLTENQAITAFKRGEVDILPNLNTTSEIFEWKTVEVEKEVRQDRYLAVFFNNSNPLFEKNVRRALSYALPKPTDETRAIGPISPDSWVYLGSGKSYDYDLDLALERILDTLPPAPLEFSLTTTADFQPEAEKIKEAWEEFGNKAFEACQNSSKVEDKNQCDVVKVAVSIRVSNFPDTSNFDTILIGQEIPPDPDQYYLWHSEQSTNFTRYKNTRIDALLEKGRTTADATERLAIYQEFQQFFLEDAPAVFIRYLDSYTVSRK